MKKLGALVGLTLAAVVAMLDVATEDHSAWKRYLAEHHCERIENDVTVQFAPVAQWSCDNGVQVESRFNPVREH